MGLFSKKKKQEEVPVKLPPVSEKLIIEQMIDDDDLAIKYVDQLKNGYPLILNFEGLDELAANKMLAFMVGATYASDGRTFQINETTFMFARNVDFEDGSLKQFIESIPRQ